MLENILMYLEYAAIVASFIGLVCVLMILEQAFYTKIQLVNVLVSGKAYKGYGEWELDIVDSNYKHQKMLLQDILATRVKVGEDINVIIETGRISGICYDIDLA